MELKPKEKAKQLYEKANEHAKLWDCYNDCPLEENHAKEVVLLWIEEIQTLLMTDEIYNPNNVSFERVDSYWEEVKEEALTL